MKKQLSLTLFLFCLMAVQGYSISPLRWGPNSSLGFSYLAQSCLSANPAPIPCTISDIAVRPEAGVWVTIFVTPVPQSGFHSHESIAPRPYPAILPAQRVQTQSDGLAHWTVQNNGWAGRYNVVMIPEDKATSDRGLLHFNNTAEQYDLEATSQDKDGVQHTFFKLRAAPYAANSPVDGRHQDSLGNAVYNVWGAGDCNAALQTAAERYLVSKVNTHARRIKPMRGALPDGGKADNEIDANGNYLFNNDSWAVRRAETHSWGVSFDILNPKLLANPNDQIDQAVEFDNVYGLFHKLHLFLNLTKPDGTTIGNENQIAQYWFGQPINHYVCQSEPVLP